MANIITFPLTDAQGNPLSGSLMPNYTSGSGIPGTAQALGVDVAGLMNRIKDELNDWAVGECGIAVISEYTTEKMMFGYNNCIGPRCRLMWTGEEKLNEETDKTGWVRRTFDVIIERGKILSDPRNSSLSNTTGQSKPFFILIEEARDVLRAIYLPQPMCYNPIQYEGTRPLSTNENGWLIDSYVISFGIIVQIPRTAYTPFTNNYVDLNGGVGWVGNTTPS